MGLMPWWGVAASRAPRLFNAVSHAPGLAPAGKRLAGLAVEREAPRFARQTFTSWFSARPRPAVAAAGQRVLLWPDTFTNLFEPDIGRAAVTVLEAAGFAIELPRRRLCCGRPLYDFGMLGPARRVLRRVLGALSPEIEAGVPVVVLEPSCASVFRDELRKLLPHDEHARRLVSQTFLLDELLERYAPGWQPPALGRRALMHGHCHQEAVMGLEGERALLARAGVDVELLNSGCCGMAGSFGYLEGDPYEVSIAAGERVLLPAVRASAPDTLVVADGFSCRTQIAACTDRRAIHSVQVLQQALAG
jgi:Fe-S oxidoreductase